MGASLSIKWWFALVSLLLLSGAARGDPWCEKCFVYEGETEISSSAFDMHFQNNCNVNVDFYYWRQPGKDTGGERRVEFVNPGSHTVTCNGSRSWLCTPVQRYTWICHAPSQSKTESSKSKSEATQSKYFERTKAAEKKAVNAEKKNEAELESMKTAEKSDTQKFEEEKRQVQNMQDENLKHRQEVKKQLEKDTRDEEHIIPQGYPPLPDNINNTISSCHYSDASVCELLSRHWLGHSFSDYIADKCFDVRARNFFGHGRIQIETVCFVRHCTQESGCLE